jgi:hypothetical protein
VLFFEQQDEARARTWQLLLLFALAVALRVLAMNAALALTWRLVTPGFSSYPAYFFTVNTVMTLVFVLGGWWLETSSLHGGGEKLARRVGAWEAWPTSRLEEQKLCNIASELAIAASMPVPQVMVLDRVVSINAFAAGWDEDDAVIAVTRGALDSLNRDELQGLVAHELSHIREGDTRLNMRLAGMVFGLELIFNLGARMCDRGDNGHRSALALPGLRSWRPAFWAGWRAGRSKQRSRCWWAARPRRAGSTRIRRWQSVSAASMVGPCLSWPTAKNRIWPIPGVKFCTKTPANKHITKRLKAGRAQARFVLDTPYGPHGAAR